MNIKRPFAPAFLNKLDNFLLLNKPSVWQARAHLVFYYSLLFIAALAAVYFVVPDDARSTSTVHVWVGFISIICIIALVAWLIYLLRFNVFKRFGIIKPATTLADFMLYFVATSVIASFCLVPLVIETVKANNQYNGSELVNDINNINLKICELKYDSLPKQWQRDSLRVVDTIPGINRPHPPPYYDDAVTATTDPDYATYPRHYRTVDTASLYHMISKGDSIVRVNDSTYVLFICHDYIFLSTYHITRHLTTKLLNSQDIYYRVFKNYVRPDTNKVGRELSLILEKYYYDDNQRYYENYDARKPYREKVKDYYKLRNVAQSIDNISQRKYRWNEYGDLFLMSWFYCSFAITLLVFGFRHTTVRVFFLSILSIAIIFILTMLFMVFFRGNEFAWCIWVVFYFILFAVIGATTFYDEKRRAVNGIAINLFAIMSPFMPLVCTALYYEWLQRQYGLVTTGLLIDYNRMLLHYNIAQIAGPLVFLVLLVVYIHKLYRRWWGLPVE